MQVKRRRGGLLRRLHLAIAVLFTANFLILLSTGFLIAHREGLRLEERSVSRHWLPAGYRPQDPGSEIRADIVLTDLHSGRLFGPAGPFFVDLAAGAWLLMMATGYGMWLLRRRKSTSGGRT